MIATILLLTSFAGGCVWNKPVQVELPREVKRPDKCVALIWADGVHSGTLQRMMAAGQLPSIQKHLFARGTQVDHAVTVVPSITFAANVSFATGLLPGHHDITGNCWFDRDTLQLEDYIGILDYLQVDGEYTAPTLFERTPDLKSVTVLTPVHRGSTRHFRDWLSTGLTIFFGTSEQVDALTAYRMNEIGREAAAAGRWPDVLWLYFSAPDHVAHQFGRDSPQYEAILRNLDVQIGRVASGLQQAGVYDRTLLVLVSDHGHAPVDPSRRADLAGMLRGYGFTVSHREMVGQTREKREKVFAPVRVVAIDDGNRRAVLHLRVSDTWADRPTLKQIERFGRDFGGPSIRATTQPFWDVLLSALPPGHLAAVRDGDNRVLITDGVGQGVVERAAEASTLSASARSYRYQVTHGPDPLGLAGSPRAGRLLDDQFHSSLDWLEATCESGVPDLVAQIVEYYDSRRSGDLVIFSMNGWQFDQPTRGGHGSALPEDMHVPMVFAGPGIAVGGHIRAARNCDVAPTLLDFLGRLDRQETRSSMDGISRLEQLRGK